MASVPLKGRNLRKLLLSGNKKRLRHIVCKLYYVVELHSCIQNLSSAKLILDPPGLWVEIVKKELY
jgi:hypothetical protein